MQEPTTSPYNPINGKELLDIILRRAHTQLSLHQDFSEAITYPAYSFTLVVDLSVPHLEEHKLSLASGSAGTVKDPKGLKHIVNALSASAPDQDRADANLEIPRPVMSSGGIVDHKTV
jgi:hypothetical protein